EVFHQPRSPRHSQEDQGRYPQYRQPGSKFRIGGNTPATPSLKLNLVLSENAPNLVFGNISKFFGNQSAVPRGVSAWRLFIEHSQDPFLSIFVVTGRFSGPWLITKPIDSLSCKPGAPFAYGRFPDT